MGGILFIRTGKILLQSPYTFKYPGIQLQSFSSSTYSTLGILKHELQSNGFSGSHAEQKGFGQTIHNTSCKKILLQSLSSGFGTVPSGQSQSNRPLINSFAIIENAHSEQFKLVEFSHLLHRKSHPMILINIQYYVYKFYLYHHNIHQDI